MGLIYAFIAGCLYTLLLVAGCLITSYKMFDYRESTDIRREEKKKALQRKNTPAPRGSVIRQKTQEEIDLENNEEATALLEMLDLPLGKE